MDSPFQKFVDYYIFLQILYLMEFRSLNQKFKQKQKWDFDKRHRTQSQEDVPEDTKVWITLEGDQVEGRVVSHTNSPRNYVVDTPTGVVRQNRQHLNVDPEELGDSEPESNEHSTEQPQSNQIITRSRTGTFMKLPERLYSFIFIS